MDDELERDNVSIENQKAIIQEFLEQKFRGSTLTFYEDRDQSRIHLKKLKMLTQLNADFGKGG